MTIEIVGWDSTFETADTRKRQTLGYFGSPTGCNSKGFRLLMRSNGGVEALGLFQAICQLFATFKKEIRKGGKLVNSDGSGMEVADLWQMIGISVADNGRLVASLTLLEKAGWLVLHDKELTENLPPTCHQLATDVPKNSGFVNVDVNVDVNGDGNEGAAAEPLPFGSDSFKEAWEDWIAYRKERKLSAWKPRTLKTKFKEFATWGEAQAIQAIRHSISNGYSGIFQAGTKRTNSTDKALDDCKRNTNW